MTDPPIFIWVVLYDLCFITQTKQNEKEKEQKKEYIAACL